MLDTAVDDIGKGSACNSVNGSCRDEEWRGDLKDSRKAQKKMSDELEV